MSELVQAYIVATVKRGTEHKVAEKIRKMKEVTEVLVTYGLWDIIARIEAKTYQKHGFIKASTQQP